MLAWDRFSHTQAFTDVSCACATARVVISRRGAATGNRYWDQPRPVHGQDPLVGRLLDLRMEDRRRWPPSGVRRPRSPGPPLPAERRLTN